MPKKQKFKPYTFEKIGGANLSAVLYASMLQSDAYLDLSANATRLYTYMKLQLFGQSDKPQGKQDCFVFNKAMYTKTYNLFTNGEQFTKFCHELIKNGFIEEVENGSTTRTKNIYRFSDKWQTWTPGTDYRPIAMQNHDNALKEKRTRQAKQKHFG